jgi:serine/threonine protein phosphatase PrpC
MNYDFCTRTDAGRARSNNEDAVLVDEALCLGILADGMGGYNAGEIASSMATTFIRTELGRWLEQAGRQANPREVRRAMEICVENANRAIFNAAHANPHYAGMGTTLVMGVFQDTRMMVGHIGDSRCYRLRGGQLSQVTRDHSLLQEQLDAGLITPEQAAVSTQKNLVTRALGVEDAVMLEVNEIRVEPGDCFLMCSDGLNDMLGDDVIEGILRLDVPLQDKATQLVDGANANGGRDNITVLLVQAAASKSRGGLISRWLGK